jgi:O-antigen biosynthesis protein
MNSKKVSLITLNLNGKEVLERLIRSIFYFNKYENYELIIIDHNSSDDSIEMIESWCDKVNIRLIAREKNYSFSASNNHGVTEATGEYVLLLNNDLTFDYDIISKVIEKYEQNEHIDLLGIKLLDNENYPTGDKINTVQHLGVFFNFGKEKQYLMPYEARYLDDELIGEKSEMSVPVVTGAFMFTTKEIFQAVGGFDEGYFYGYEDVDFCLKLLESGREIFIDLENYCYHAHGYSRKKFDTRSAQRLHDNKLLLDQNFASKVRSWYRRDVLKRPGFWTGQKPRLAFAVTEAKPETLAGDFFTGYELAHYFQKEHSCDCFFLEHKKTWFNLENFDLLVVLRDDYDLTLIESASPNLLTIAWVRNWFERFAESHFADKFDVVVSSSEKSKAYLSEKLNKTVHVLRIAANSSRFENAEPSVDLASDVCFTGSFWGAQRDIINNLDPRLLPFNIKFFGAGWDKIEQFKNVAYGSIEYACMPSVYASTKIIIDDANSVTKEWGSVNSRVFDAISANRLVVTNGALGSFDTFEGILPVYNNKAELEDLLEFYLNNETERNDLVSKLKEILSSRHTYQHRANELITILTDGNLNSHGTSELEKKRIAIKIGAPNMQVAKNWGDYHFALSMKKCFEKHGYLCRVDCLDKWYNSRCNGDDIVIVLRGLSSYEPKKHQINLMWNISHPDKISPHEYSLYDHVFVASSKYQKFLEENYGINCSTLLQCTDPEHFNLTAVEDLTEAEVGLNLDGKFIFVGNSRNVFRPSVKIAVENDWPLIIYGSLWDQYVDKSFIEAEYLPNSKLRHFYCNSMSVLNDHWQSMIDYGFISNRFFDVAASGGVLVTDYVEGMEDLEFGNVVYLTEDSESLINELEALDFDSVELSNYVHEHHSFEARCSIILKVIEGFLVK